DGAIADRPLVGPDGHLYVMTGRGSLYKIRVSIESETRDDFAAAATRDRNMEGANDEQ
ncbi:MAG: hypothetical protein H5T99_01710, partial [Moorella sp. (in: Bacteria)]|nr:hypothetical protein [Moorella sp. (in: firmicutes)]